jgi:hypothetical protein
VAQDGAGVRDHLALGLLDGAHMLAPLALACHLGLSGPQARLIDAEPLLLREAALHRGDQHRGVGERDVAELQPHPSRARAIVTAADLLG